jgi:hypothetical protein
MRLNSFVKVFPLLALGFVLPSQGITIVASGAGALPGTAQDLTGLDPTEITGSIPDTIDPILGVNMFKIDIVDPLDFSAITMKSSFGITDTELFLFDSNANGVYMNDDLGGGDPTTYTLSCLPSADGSNPCSSSRPSGVGPTSPGIYYLAISRSSNMPTSAGNEIFNVLNSTDVVGPSISGAVDGWDGGAFTSDDPDLVNFDIVLTGTTTSAVPEPAITTLIGAAGLVLVFLRRKLSVRR